MQKPIQKTQSAETKPPQDSKVSTQTQQHQKKLCEELVIVSKKVQINTLDHQLIQQFVKISKQKQQLKAIKKIKIEGNSYSREVCQFIGKEVLSYCHQLQSLDINDIFVSRLKEEIPISIQYMAKGLLKNPLIKLDISNNAVNPYGAKALLHYLEQADQLELLYIANCGLGPLGVAEIAKGLKGTKNLKTLSIGRNRMQNQGILSLSASLEFVPELKQLFVYQNTLKKDGLLQLFKQLRKNCLKFQSFDLCDNFVRQQATDEMMLMIKQMKTLRNLNLSDCLNEEQNEKIVEAFEKTQNHQFQRLGFNFIQLTPQLAKRLLNAVKQYPLKRLDILGNEFPKSVKKLYDEAFKDKGVLSKYDDDEDDEEQITRLFEELKL